MPLQNKDRNSALGVYKVAWRLVPARCGQLIMKDTISVKTIMEF